MFETLFSVFQLATFQKISLWKFCIYSCFPIRVTRPVHHLLQSPSTITTIRTCGRIRVEKLKVAHLVKKFPVIYRNLRFNTVFTRPRHLIHTWATSIQSTPTILTILSFHLRLGFGSDLSPSGIRLKFCIHFSSSAMHYIYGSFYRPWLDRPDDDDDDDENKIMHLHYCVNIRKSYPCRSRKIAQ